MFIVVYRPHYELNAYTRHIGPFATHDEAYDALCALPAVGVYNENAGRIIMNPGVKYIVELEVPNV